MRTRTELLIAGTAAALLITLAFTRGLADRGNVNLDSRASTFVQSPFGWSALAEIAQATGHVVVRNRSRSPAPAGTGTRHTLLIVANARLGAADQRELLIAGHEDEIFARDTLADITSPTSLLVAGPANDDLFRCLGYEVEPRFLASIRVEGAGRSPAVVRAAIQESADTSRTLSSGGFDDEVLCPVVRVVRVDTVLRGTEGAVVALRLHKDDGTKIYLLADAALMSNESIKQSSAAMPLLDELLSNHDRLAFDEFHHGFGPGGSLLGATVAWSRRSPWGWALWQLALVGLLVFVSGAVRFGPVRTGIQRQRRSSVEHVKALATALSAAQGHDVAIGAVVRGLQRRLSAAGRANISSAEDWRTWVRLLPARMTTPAAQQAAQKLVPFTEPNQPVAAVQRAAHAVEDVWHALHPLNQNTPSSTR